MELISYICFCLTSIPYYGFDYLCQILLGFFSQDKSLVWANSTPTFKSVFQRSNSADATSFINTSLLTKVY
jgi:hypothetical protein